LTPEFLKYRFIDDDNFINSFDEAPLWSAAFGLMLLKHLDFNNEGVIIDIGSGTGFPLLEIAARLGNNSKLYGIDPWKNANQRARQKIKNYGLSNVQIIETGAEQIPLDKETVDLIVSNLGINNFSDPASVFIECFRLLKKGGRIAITTNLKGHWKEFYELFYVSLEKDRNHDLISVLRNDENHRSTIESVKKMYSDCGFKVMKVYEDTLPMNFANGTAFLNHHFIQVGWLTTWMNILPAEELDKIFSNLEADLNEYSAMNNGLRLTVPMAYIEGVK
jgi:arsenite methyltransferase